MVGLDSRDLVGALVLCVRDPVPRVDAELGKALLLARARRLLDLLVDPRDRGLADLVVLALEAHPGVVPGGGESRGEVLSCGAGGDVPVGLRDRLAAAALVGALDAELDRAVQLLHAVQVEGDLEIDVRALDRRGEGLVERVLHIARALAPAGSHQRCRECQRDEQQ